MKTPIAAALFSLTLLGCEPPSLPGAKVLGPPTTEVVPATPAERAAAPDTLPPRTGAPITFDRVDGHAVALHWGEAVDARTPAGELSYALAAAGSAEELDTVDKAAAAVAAHALMGWSPGTTSAEVEGLSDGALYWFAVLVRDAAGNRALYPPASALTPDVTAPEIGTPLVFSYVTPYAVVVSWGAARDNVTSASLLEYELLRSDDPSSFAPGEATVPIVPATDMPWTPVFEHIVESLPSGSSWWFAVRVRDQAGNVSLYPPGRFQMP